MSDQQQNAETQAHNAVSDALHSLNVAETANNNRRQVVQAAQEQLDAAHAQLAEARTTQSSANSEDDESLS